LVKKKTQYFKKNIRPDFELTKPHTVRFDTRMLKNNLQHPTRQQIKDTTKTVGVFDVLYRERSTMERRRRSEKHHHQRSKGSSAGTRRRLLNNSMAGEGPCPLALAQKGVERPAMDMLPLSIVQSPVTKQ
jgi:hypothetical protein